MTGLSQFFEVNHEIILFVYGLVFFILGLGIIIRSRQASRLELARSLRWLAAFGITHAFNEWGDLFIPIQAEYFPHEFVRSLYILQLFLLSISFVCLFEFGVATLRSLDRGAWLQGLSGGLMTSWIVGCFIVLLPLLPNEETWRNLAIAFSRYFIGFPGGMLAAYALRAYSLERIAPLQVPKIVTTFQIAGISLGLYAILAGVIPPPIDIFPGNIVNSQSFMEYLGAPPWIYRSTVAFIISISIIRALEIFELETQRRIEALEQGQIIAYERERLARELHDGTIQKAYTAGLLVESAAQMAHPTSKIGKRLNQAVEVLNDTIGDLRQNLVDLHSIPQSETDPLPTMVGHLIKNPHYNSMVNITLDVQWPDDKSLSARRTRHVMAIINEALANTVRHAQASEVKLSLDFSADQLKVEIKDNGIGIPLQPVIGYGLRNMRDRARLLNGTIDFTNDQGTTAVLVIPWKDDET